MEFRGATHATECPFCATPVVIDTGSHRRLKPQALVPFQLSEEQARDREPIEVYATAFRPMRTAFAGRPDRVMMKLIVSQTTRKVLGCHIVAPEAGEMIQLAAIAVKMGATATFGEKYGDEVTEKWNNEFQRQQQNVISLHSVTKNLNWKVIEMEYQAELSEDFIIKRINDCA